MPLRVDQLRITASTCNSIEQVLLTIEMKTRKTFKYEEIELRIVYRGEGYMESGTVEVTRVLAPNGGVIPVKMEKGQTLKTIIEETIKTLDNFKSLGADIESELTKDMP